MALNLLIKFNYNMNLENTINKPITTRFFIMTLISRVIISIIMSILWILSPFKRIRIFKGEVTRIGHLATYFEVLIRNKEINIDDNKEINLFIVPKSHANKTLYKMWKKRLYLIESNFLSYIFILGLSGNLVANKKNFGPIKIQQGGLPIKKPTLSFAVKDRIKGINLLKEMGVNSDDWYVCLHSRNPAYLKNRGNKDYSYMNLRDSAFEMLEESAKFIHDIGGKNIRMHNGDNSMLSKRLSKYIIDYSYNWHSDFMDIFLPSNCKFFLGGGSGLISVSHIFNVPVAVHNIWPVATVSVPENCLFIPKLLWYKEEKRFLSYKEITDNNLHKLNSHFDRKVAFKEDFEKAGIEIIENDNDDIKLLTKDMLDLVNNIKIPIKDEEIRNNFTKKYFNVNRFKNNQSNYKGLDNAGKISWRFLLKHSYLMDK